MLADFYIFKHIKILAMSQSNSRRKFLRSTAVVAAGVTIIPRQVLGRGFIAPSDQLTKGIIGLGGMGRGHIGLGYKSGCTM